jgi:uncharacterized paraquat-inducible protein A
MAEAERDDRQAVRNAWIDQQMATLPRCQSSMRKTITAGIATGTATAVSTLIVSVIRWALHLLLASSYL